MIAVSPGSALAYSIELAIVLIEVEPRTVVQRLTLPGGSAIS